LAREITGKRGVIGFTSQEQDLCRGGEVFRHIWVIECADVRGEYLAELEWDADSGDLLKVTRSTPARTRKPEMNRVEAIWTVRTWIETLGMASGSTHWSLARQPVHFGGIWRTYWRAGARLAVVCVDARSGELVNAASIFRTGPHPVVGA
jgi:hypothetical protein